MFYYINLEGDNRGRLCGDLEYFCGGIMIEIEMFGKLKIVC